MDNYSGYKKLLSVDSGPINEAENIRNVLQWLFNSTVLNPIFIVRQVTGKILNVCHVGCN